jgi:hypothetical protein
MAPPVRTIYPTTTITVPDTIPTGLDTDATDQLNAWLNNIPDGPGEMRDIYGTTIPNIRAATIVELNANPYRVDGTLNLVGLADLVIRGLNITRIAQAGGGTYKTKPHIIFNHCTFLTLIDPVVTGPNTTYTYQAQRETETAYRFLGAAGCELIRPRATGIWGDHLYFGRTNQSPVRARSILVVDGIFGHSARDPIAAASAENVTIRNCTFEGGRTCIDAEPNGAQGGVYGLTVDGCTFGTHTGIFLASVGGSTIGIVDGVTINNCSTAGDLQILVGGGERRANFTITDNTGAKQYGAARACVMKLTGTTGTTTVTGNTNPMDANKHMHMARFYTHEGIELAPGPDNGIIYSDNHPDDSP